MKLIRELSTALRFLRDKSLEDFCHQVKVSLRRSRLERVGEEPFVYRLKGMPFVCFGDLPDSREVFIQRELDNDEDELMRGWLKPGDVVLNAGANIGLYTWRAHHFLCGNGTFIAVDASKRICNYLRRAAELTNAGSVRVCSCALGDRAGEVKFYEAPPGCFAVEQSLKVDATCGHMVPVKTQMATLGQVGEITGKRTKPSLIKVDIEGAEVMALTAAPKEWLEGAGPLWIVEINVSALGRFESTPQQVLDFFPQDKFQRLLLPKFPKKGGRLGLPRLTNRDESFGDALFYNLVAIPHHAGRRVSLRGASYPSTSTE